MSERVHHRREERRSQGREGPLREAAERSAQGAERVREDFRDEHSALPIACAAMNAEGAAAGSCLGLAPLRWGGSGISAGGVGPAADREITVVRRPLADARIGGERDAGAVSAGPAQVEPFGQVELRGLEHLEGCQRADGSARVEVVGPPRLQLFLGTALTLHLAGPRRIRQRVEDHEGDPAPQCRPAIVASAEEVGRSGILDPATIAKTQTHPDRPVRFVTVLGWIDRTELDVQAAREFGPTAIERAGVELDLRGGDTCDQMRADEPVGPFPSVSLADLLGLPDPSALLVFAEERAIAPLAIDREILERDPLRLDRQVGQGHRPYLALPFEREDRPAIPDVFEGRGPSKRGERQVRLLAGELRSSWCGSAVNRSPYRLRYPTHAETARSRRYSDQYCSHAGASSSFESFQAMESQTRNVESTPCGNSATSGLFEVKLPDWRSIVYWTKCRSPSRTVPSWALLAIAAIRPSRNPADRKSGDVSNSES